MDDIIANFSNACFAPFPIRWGLCYISYALSLWLVFTFTLIYRKVANLFGLPTIYLVLKIIINIFALYSGFDEDSKSERECAIQTKVETKNWFIGWIFCVVDGGIGLKWNRVDAVMAAVMMTHYCDHRICFECIHRCVGRRQWWNWIDSIPNIFDESLIRQTFFFSFLLSIIRQSSGKNEQLTLLKIFNVDAVIDRLCAITLCGFQIHNKRCE